MDSGIFDLVEQIDMMFPANRSLTARDRFMGCFFFGGGALISLTACERNAFCWYLVKFLDLAQPAREICLPIDAIHRFDLERLVRSRNVPVGKRSRPFPHSAD